MIDLASKIKTGKTIMITTTVTPQITGSLKRVPIQLENQRRIQRDYPLADKLPENIETYKLGLLIGNDYYNDIILNEHKEIQYNLYVNQNVCGLYLAEFHQPMTVRKKMSRLQ